MGAVYRHNRLARQVPVVTPFILVIEAGRMFRDGHKFFRSENGVWLTDAVPPAYIRE